MRVSHETVRRILTQAKEVPDNVVHETMAIGIDEIHERIEEFAKAGLRNLAVADLFAPKTVKRTLSNFRRVIQAYA
jgi:magnesium-transporting ATPase (P-type)